jgi:hypothetical protein
MEERTTFFEDSVERFQAGFRNAGEELQKLQNRAASNSRKFGKRAQAQALEIQKQLLEFPPIKAADGFRTDIYKQVESNIQEALNRIPVASQDDLKKLEKKVNAMARKIKTLEKANAEYEANA